MEKCGRARQANMTNIKNYNCFDSLFPRGNNLSFGGWTECGIKG